MTTSLPPLVGLIGKKRVGKDTFAAVLVEEFGFARVAFADPLKQMALTIDPIISPLYFRGLDSLRITDAVGQDGWEHTKDTYPEVRRFLQRLGDGVRQFDPEFWVRAGMQHAEYLRHDQPYGDSGDYAPATPVVITDVRYPNEADAIREAGGTLVRIVRPGVDDGDTHPSETALGEYAVDYTVSNLQDTARLGERARYVAGWVGAQAI